MPDGRISRWSRARGKSRRAANNEPDIRARGEALSYVVRPEKIEIRDALSVDASYDSESIPCRGNSQRAPTIRADDESLWLR
jgi:hypothetical protein